MRKRNSNPEERSDSCPEELPDIKNARDSGTINGYLSQLFDSSSDEEKNTKEESDEEFVFDSCTVSRLDSVKKGIHISPWLCDPTTHKIVKDDQGNFVKNPSIAERISIAYKFSWEMADTENLSREIIKLLRYKWNSGKDISYCGELDPATLLTYVLEAFAGGPKEHTEFGEIKKQEGCVGDKPGAIRCMCGIVEKNLKNKYKKWDKNEKRKHPIDENEDDDNSPNGKLPKQLHVYEGHKQQYALGPGKNELENKIVKAIKNEPLENYPKEFIYWFDQANIYHSAMKLDYRRANALEKKQILDDVCGDMNEQLARFPGVMQYVRGFLKAHYDRIQLEIPQKFFDDANEYYRVGKARDKLFIRIESEIRSGSL